MSNHATQSFGFDKGRIEMCVFVFDLGPRAALDDERCAAFQKKKETEGKYYFYKAFLASKYAKIT